MNLLQNAAQVTPAGGSVTVAAELERTPVLSNCESPFLAAEFLLTSCGTAKEVLAKAIHNPRQSVTDALIYHDSNRFAGAPLLAIYRFF